MLLGPNCVFTYGNQLQNIDVAFVTGANVEEAWLYGARMEGDKGIVTGNSGDVIKGKALCWSKLLFKDKLQHVDGKQGYNVAAPEQLLFKDKLQHVDGKQGYNVAAPEQLLFKDKLQHVDGKQGYNVAAPEQLLFKDKLQHVDGKQGYNVAAPEQGRSRRQQGKVVKRDGSALPAFFYFPNIGGAASASSSYELVSLVQKPAHSYRKALLLDNNGGVWSGSFIKLDGNGREMERWTTRLDVTEAIDGTIYAALTNTITGEVRSMNFQEPPNEMQLTNQGHWTLGPEAIGPFAWISELCLTNPAKGERRRAVIRHTGTGLEWFTMVWENRPGLPNVIPPSAPIQASYTLIGDRQVWTLEPGLELITMHTRKQGAPHEVGLRWRPEPTSSWLEVFRRHNEYGTLQPLACKSDKVLPCVLIYHKIAGTAELRMAFNTLSPEPIALVSTVATQRNKILLGPSHYLHLGLLRDHWLPLEILSVSG
eukprot:g20976.t1